MIRKVFSAIVAIFIFTVVSAQMDSKAKFILDKTLEVYKQSSGVSISFTGSHDGRLLLDHKKFVLETSDVISWFDGETLWTYVKSSEEVNVSNPSEDELKAINPYELLGMYRHGFNYSYNGNKKMKGNTVDMVTLYPADNSTSIKSIALSINSKYQATEIKMTDMHQNSQHFIVEEYKTHISYDDSTFKFDSKKYPEAEIIDLR